jgi:hypothetical protein
VKTKEKTLEQTLLDLPGADVTDVTRGDIAKMIVVTFNVQGSLGKIHKVMGRIFCAALPKLPEGYGVVIAGKNARGLTVITARMSAETIAGHNCPSALDWPIFADEYNAAPGLYNSAKTLINRMFS